MEKNNKGEFLGIKMLVSGIVTFVGVLAFMPSSSVLRTLPLVLVLAAIGDFVYKNMLYTSGCCMLFSFCMMCAQGKTVLYSTVYSAAIFVLSIGCVYAVRLLRAAFKTQNQELKRKCNIRSVMLLAVCFAVYMIFCGNIFSCTFAARANHSYIKENYADSIKIHHTEYDAVNREYKTYVSFNDGKYVVGSVNDCYVSSKKDCIRSYYEEKIMTEGKKQIKAALSKAVDMFEVTNCGIFFDEGEILGQNPVYEDYAQRAWYVVSLYHITENREGFEKIYQDCLEYLKDTEFKEMVLCTGNARKVLFTATVKKDTNGEMIAQEITDFDERYLEQYGVTEMTVLDYWNNR